MELSNYRVVAGAYNRVGLAETGVQASGIEKLIVPFDEPFLQL